MTGRQITIYGNGKQVRDVLYIDDLLDALITARDRIEDVSGEIFNIGGGPTNTISIWWEMQEIVERLLKRELPAPAFAPTRPGDQPVYVSDIRKAESLLNWKPAVMPEAGIGKLLDWIELNKSLFA